MFTLCAIIHNLCHDIFYIFSSYYLALDYFDTLLTFRARTFCGLCSSINLSTMLVIIDRGYMVLCGYCQRNVTPKMYFSWKGFICGLGIFYLIYSLAKIPQCPNCNFPMPRRNMVFAIQLPQYLIETARMSLLQLTHFKDRVISASRSSYLNRRFEPSEHSTSMNTRLTASFNVMANEVHSSIDSESYSFGK